MYAMSEDGSRGRSTGRKTTYRVATAANAAQMPANGPKPGWKSSTMGANEASEPFACGLAPAIEAGSPASRRIESGCMIRGRPAKDKKDLSRPKRLDWAPARRKPQASVSSVEAMRSIILGLPDLIDCRLVPLVPAGAPSDGSSSLG